MQININKPKFLEKFTNKQIALAIATLLVCLALYNLAAASIFKKRQPNITPVVRTQTIQDVNSDLVLNYAGEVRGRFENQLAFQASGRIIKRNIELGSTVNAGDVLMQIDPKDIEQNTNMAAAQLSAAQAQLDLAAKNLERYQKLYDQQAISRLQLDNIQLQYQSALASYRQAAAGYTQSSNMLGYTMLVANAPGVISSISAEVGQVVSAGTPVAVLVQDGDREIEISIPESRIQDFRKATAIKAQFWALNNITVNGTVREISPMADPTTRTYKARIALNTPPPNLALGMTANVFVDTGKQTAVLLPLSAIYQTQNQPSVWVVQDNKVQLRPVSVGDVVGDKVQILSGLQAGDNVVTAGVHKLRENQIVHLSAGDKS